MPYVKRRATVFLIVTIIATAFLIALMILLMTQHARAATTPDAGLPAGATCELVRVKVAERGKAASLAWALRQGFSFAQIRAAKRCLSTK